MSELLNKSQKSCDAAEALITQHGFFAASVHCSYYSCIQLITYAFYYVLPPLTGVTKQQFVHNSSYNRGGLGSHEYLHSEMKKAITARATLQDAVAFDSTIKALKRTRTDADYKEHVINDIISREAQKKSIAVNTIIKSIFSIT